MVSVVIGANRGIGLELAKQLQARGDTVVATSRSAAPDELKLDKVSVVENVDVCKADTLPPLVEACSAGVTTLIVNAGLLIPASDGKKFGEFGEEDFANFTTEWEVNAMGPLRVVVALLPKLQEGAKVVLLGTTLASNASNKDGGAYGYRSSKAALHNIGHTLAIDLKGKQSVAVIHPGMVETGMTTAIGFKAGENGVLTTSESATNVIKVVDKVSADNSGQAWDAGTGENFPW